MTTPIQAALDALARGLGEIDGMKEARVWEGAWEVLESPGQLSFQSPAALVSLVEFGLADVGMTVGARRGVAQDPAVRRAVTTAGARSPELQVDGVVRATADVEIAVTIVASTPGAEKRAETALGLATRAVPVLVGQALRGIAGTNLDSPKLRARGISAFVLMGQREIELDPPGDGRDWCPEGVEFRPGMFAGAR